MLLINMTKEEILHLGTLARIKLTDVEAEKLNANIDDILAYVSMLDDIVADYSALTKQVGPVHNVFREDEVTNEPSSHTADLVAEFPDKQGNHLRVKKILSTDE